MFSAPKSAKYYVCGDVFSDFWWSAYFSLDFGNRIKKTACNHLWLQVRDFGTSWVTSWDIRKWRFFGVGTGHGGDSHVNCLSGVPSLVMPIHMPTPLLPVLKGSGCLARLHPDLIIVIYRFYYLFVGCCTHSCAHWAWFWHGHLGGNPVVMEYLKSDCFPTVSWGMGTRPHVPQKG
jgi:hypothetical protein